MQSASRSERMTSAMFPPRRLGLSPLDILRFRLGRFAVRSKRFFGIHGKMGLSRSHILLAPKERMKEYFLCWYR